MKTAVIMSEDAAWTKPLDVGYEECLPKIGLKVLDHIRFSPDTTDFTPIFNKIEGEKPDVIITGISAMSACSRRCSGRTSRCRSRCSASASQATNETFWKDTNGAADGVLYQGVSGPASR
jgi:branched-chain amino acid transport system substrate-binding protein